MKLNGSQIVLECLKAEGVDVMFGLPGGAILPFYQTLPEYPEIRHILVRHEQGRLPGVRCHRHHTTHNQAQLLGHGHQ